VFKGTLFCVSLNGGGGGGELNSPSKRRTPKVATGLVGFSSHF